MIREGKERFVYLILGLMVGGILTGIVVNEFHERKRVIGVAAETKPSSSHLHNLSGSAKKANLITSIIILLPSCQQKGFRMELTMPDVTSWTYEM